MDIRLDDLDLIKVIRDSPESAAKEIRSISSVDVRAERSIVEIIIPGSEGNVHQNMGRAPIRIFLRGLLWGPDAKTTLETLRSKCGGGAPIQFTSDLSGATEVDQVIIEQLNVDEVAGLPSRYDYTIVLKEYRELGPPIEEEAPQQEGEAEQEVEDEKYDAIQSQNYVTGKILDAEGNAKQGMTVIISGDGAEYRVTTDDEGVYRKDELPPGRYTITVDSDEYTGIQEEVVVE